MARDSCLARVTAGAAVGGAVGGAVGQLSTSSYNFIHVMLTANCSINFFSMFLIVPYILVGDNC